jgi:hypothetical protein
MDGKTITIDRTELLKQQRRALKDAGNNIAVTSGFSEKNQRTEIYLTIQTSPDVFTHLLFCEKEDIYSLEKIAKKLTEYIDKAKKELEESLEQSYDE